MGSPELYTFIFYRDLHALCISDICFKTVQLREWKIFTKKALKFGSIDKKYFYFCKLLYIAAVLIVFLCRSTFCSEKKYVIKLCR